MASFDQRGQRITGNQYNAGRDLNLSKAGRDLNFGSVREPVDLIVELEKLKEEIVQAKEEGVIDKKKATDVEYQITKATQEAEEAKPNKKTIIDHLTAAKSLIEGVVATSGLVTALVGAIEAVQKLFS